MLYPQHQYYHLNEHQGKHPNFSKNSLGQFVYDVLRFGGDIHQLWAFNIRYPRSAVYPVISLHPDKAEQFQQETGYLLTNPPKIKLN